MGRFGAISLWRSTLPSNPVWKADRECRRSLRCQDDASEGHAGIGTIAVPLEWQLALNPRDFLVNSQKITNRRRAPSDISCRGNGSRDIP
jgi:hypothetical protein